MIPAFVVVLDACVLFPASLRDTLLRAANARLYRLQLTEEILEEVRRNLANKGLPKANAQRIYDTIRHQFSEAFITSYQPFISAMPINEKDRHVLAAAVASRAQVIVTQNLKDFPQALLAPFEIEAQSSDDFLTHLYELEPIAMLHIIAEQAGELRNPPKTIPELLDTLQQHVPNLVRLVRQDMGIA